MIGSLGIVALLWAASARTSRVLDQILQDGTEAEQQMPFADNKMIILTFGTSGSFEDAVIFDVTAQNMARVDYERQQTSVGSAKDLKKMIRLRMSWLMT